MGAENLRIEFVGGSKDGRWIKVPPGLKRYSVPIMMRPLAVHNEKGIHSAINRSEEVYIITKTLEGKRIAVEETLFEKGRIN